MKDRIMPGPQDEDDDDEEKRDTDDEGDDYEPQGDEARHGRTAPAKGRIGQWSAWLKRRLDASNLERKS
jgi:hypothetical protein